MSKPLTPTQIKVLVDKLYREASAAWNEKLNEVNRKANAERKDKEAAARKAKHDYIAAGKFTKNDLAHMLCFYIGRDSMTKQEISNAQKSVLCNKDEPKKEGKREDLEGHRLWSPGDQRGWRARDRDVNHPVERLIDELKFKLTMASAENYQQFMTEFRASLKAALDKVK